MWVSGVFYCFIFVCVMCVFSIIFNKIPKWHSIHYFTIAVARASYRGLQTPCPVCPEEVYMGTQTLMNTFIHMSYIYHPHLSIAFMDFWSNLGPHQMLKNPRPRVALEQSSPLCLNANSQLSLLVCPHHCSHWNTNAFGCSHHSAKREVLKRTGQGNHAASKTDRLPSTQWAEGQGVGSRLKPRFLPISLPPLWQLHLTILSGFNTHHTINCLNKFQRAHPLLLMNPKSGHPELQSAARCFARKKRVGLRVRADSSPLPY